MTDLLTSGNRWSKYNVYGIFFLSSVANRFIKKVRFLRKLPSLYYKGILKWQPDMLISYKITMIMTFGQEPHLIVNKFSASYETALPSEFNKKKKKGYHK